MTKVIKYALLTELLHIPKMHLASQSAIDAVIRALKTDFNGKCFVQELYYIGSDVKLFLSNLYPGAEICLISGGGLFSMYSQECEEESWFWNPETGWIKIETDEDVIHSSHNHMLKRVDNLSTLGGIDAEDPFS